MTEKRSRGFEYPREWDETMEAMRREAGHRSINELFCDVMGAAITKHRERAAQDRPAKKGKG
jgi:hypothetical protein